MDTIQTDVSDQALITTIRADMCVFFRYLGRRFPEDYFQNESYARWHLPIAHRWFNGVLCSLLAEESDTAFSRTASSIFVRGMSAHSPGGWNHT